MKLSTNLDYMDVAFALEKAKQDGLVSRDVSFILGLVPHGSRTHLASYEVQLGTYDRYSLPAGYTDQFGHLMHVRRYKNSGHEGATSEWNGEPLYAATWDEWGWFMANVFAADPGAVFGNVRGRAHGYRGADDFHWKTKGKFRKQETHDEQDDVPAAAEGGNMARVPGPGTRPGGTGRPAALGVREPESGTGAGDLRQPQPGAADGDRAGAAVGGSGPVKRPWTFEDTIRNVQHVSWYWPDGVHTREELRVLEPGRRDYDAPCPCGCGEQ